MSMEKKEFDLEIEKIYNYIDTWFNKLKLSILKDVNNILCPYNNYSDEQFNNQFWW